MVMQVDHPITAKGVQQAQRLCEKIRSGAGTGNPDVTDFLDAQMVVSSPLARAIQTALIGIRPVLQRVGSLLLLSNAREKRNLGGMDSTSNQVGSAIRDRAISELRVFGIEGREFQGIEIDTTDVEHKWWSNIQESKSEVRERIHEFMAQIRGLPASRIIVVGHSHFFREVFRNFIHPNFAARNPSLTEDISTHVIENCGVIAVDVDFFHSRMIMDARFIFGSTVVKKDTFSLRSFLHPAQLRLLTSSDELGELDEETDNSETPRNRD